MNAANLIREAGTLGVQLWADGPALRYRGATEVLQALLPALKANKPELLRLLTSAATPEIHNHEIQPRDLYQSSQPERAETEPARRPDIGLSRKPADGRVAGSDPAPQTAITPTPAYPLPAPWDAIRDLIQAGWRAELGTPGPDGQQKITWHPPGTWTPSPLPLRRNATSGPVRCADCQHQQATTHPALIVCGAGRESPAACGYWWSADPRDCKQFKETAP